MIEIKTEEESNKDIRMIHEENIMDEGSKIKLVTYESDHDQKFIEAINMSREKCMQKLQARQHAFNNLHTRDSRFKRFCNCVFGGCYFREVY